MQQNRMALALAMAFPILACAQEAPSPRTLGTVVVTPGKSGSASNDFGAKSGIPLDQVPQSVQVLDEEDFLARGALTIEDALRAVPSAATTHSEVSGFSGATLRIRGFQADQIRNGMRQRFYEDVDPSALWNVERIEVLKGPSAVLYGESGVGGIVSIITKQPTAKFAGLAALTLGSYGRKIATFDLGGPVSDTFGIRLTGEFEDSGTFVDFQDIRRDNLGLSLAWRPSASVSAHLVTEYSNRYTAANPGLPTVGTIIGNGVAKVPRSRFLGEPSSSLEATRAPLLQAWVDFKLNDTWTLTPRFQYNEWNHTSRASTLLAPDPATPTLIPRLGRNAGEQDDFRVAQLDLSGRVRAFGLDHKLLFGAEYSNDRVNFRMESAVPCGIGPIDALNPVYGCGAPTSNFGFLAPNYLDGRALYVQDQIALTPKWNVVAGVRHSEFEDDTRFITDFGTTFNTTHFRKTVWELGSTYALGGGLSLFGGYNTGFDVERQLQARRASGVPFQPESYRQLEAGVRLAGTGYQASASVFRITRDNAILPDSDPANAGFNVQGDRFRVQGLELEGEWSPRPGWWLQGGYAFLDAKVARSSDPTQVGARLAETPRHAVTAATRVSVGPVELRAAANYVGARKMVNGGAVTLPNYTTVDVGAGTRIGPWRLDATVTNVFDKTYYYSENLSVFAVGGENIVHPGEPRSLRVRASYSF